MWAHNRTSVVKAGPKEKPTRRENVDCKYCCYTVTAKNNLQSQFVSLKQMIIKCKSMVQHSFVSKLNMSGFKYKDTAGDDNFVIYHFAQIKYINIQTWLSFSLCLYTVQVTFYKEGLGRNWHWDEIRQKSMCGHTSTWVWVRTYWHLCGSHPKRPVMSEGFYPNRLRWEAFHGEHSCQYRR